MSTIPRNSQALAEALREDPPVLDELARARIEKRILAAAAAPREARRSRAPIAIAGALALAAAAALAFVALREGAPEAPVARIHLYDVGAAEQRGTLDEGSTVSTGATEQADVRVADTRVRIGSASRLRIATLTADHLGLDLLEGSIHVAYRPRERGRERLTVETPSARVEVVGTVFRVEVRERTTEVSVSEGTVRVVPHDGSEPRFVRAGERTVVTRASSDPAVSRLEVGGSTEGTGPPEAGGPGAAGASETVEAEGAGMPATGGTGEDESARATVLPSLDPAARLERAKSLGRTAAAARILRELTRPNTPAEVRTEAWSTLGDLHRSAGRLHEAARAYEQAAQVGRGTASGHNAIYLLARLHQQRGDREAARASYERYLREAPSGALAEQARRALLRLEAASE